MSDLIYLTCLQIEALHSIGDCIFNQKISLTISNRDIFLNYHSMSDISKDSNVYFFHLASCPEIENVYFIDMFKVKAEPCTVYICCLIKTCR